jgi:hypothetical protein
MALQTVILVLERVHTDDTFRRQCMMDPARALASYDLLVEERAALLSGDWRQFDALGVERRFVVGHSFPLGSPR